MHFISCNWRILQVVRTAILTGLLALASAGALSQQVRLTAYQYFVQVGAFTAANSATALVEQLQKKYFEGDH